MNNVNIFVVGSHDGASGQAVQGDFGLLIFKLVKNGPQRQLPVSMS